MQKSRGIIGLLLVLVGIALLLRTLDILYFDFGDFVRLVIPLALIALGGWIIIRRRRQLENQSPPGSAPPPPPPGAASSATGTSQSYRPSGAPPPPPSQSPEYGESGKVRYSKLLGDMFIDCNGVGLQNVEVSMGVGDIDIRLAGGKLSDGLNRMVISGFIGDVVIIAPRDMPLFIHTSAFVGDVDILGRRASGFGNTLDHQTENYPGATAKMYIAVNCFISDIRLYYI